MDYQNLNVWITGASSGIGLALAQSFAQRNSTVVISSRNKNKLIEALHTIGRDKKVFLFPCDVSNPEQIAAVYDKILASGIKINVLVNNAGCYHSGAFINFPLEKFEESFSTNVRGVFLCTQAVLPEMLKMGFGIIINMLSVVVTKTFVNASIYSATKAAVWAMSKSLREEIRDKNIKIMNVYPGATSTNIWSPRVLEKYGERMMKPEEIADTILCNIETSLRNGVMVEELIIRPQLGDL